jgi:hypothetical protein
MRLVTKAVAVAPLARHLKMKAPAGEDWIHEIKYDGYRIQLHIDGDTRKPSPATATTGSNASPTLPAPSTFHAKPSSTARSW